MLESAIKSGDTLDNEIFEVILSIYSRCLCTWPIKQCMLGIPMIPFRPHKSTLTGIQTLRTSKDVNLQVGYFQHCSSYFSNDFYSLLDNVSDLLIFFAVYSYRLYKRVQRILEVLLVLLPFCTRPTVRQRRMFHLPCPNFYWEGQADKWIFWTLQNFLLFFRIIEPQDSLIRVQVAFFIHNGNYEEIHLNLIPVEIYVFQASYSPSCNQWL